MYKRIKEKFNLEECKINEIITERSDCKELFDDYESSCLQFEKCENDNELYTQYKELIGELEEEINRILINH